MAQARTDKGIRKTLSSRYCNTLPREKEIYPEQPAWKINCVSEKEDEMIFLLLLDILRNLQFRSYLLMISTILTWWKR